MNPVNRFLPLVESIAQLMKDGESLSLGGLPPVERPDRIPDLYRALIFPPHPDDEALSGTLVERVADEMGADISCVPITFGSDKNRQFERLRELQSSCDFLGMGMIMVDAFGFEKVTCHTRETQEILWNKMVKIIVEILTRVNPSIIFIPHDKDKHSTHIGVHYLIIDALTLMPASFECLVVETEYWGDLENPNVMVELSVKSVANLVAATSFHAGEVKRNPYHIRLPMLLADNVRRAEIVLGPGKPAPNFSFAALYRIRKWSQGGLNRYFEGGRIVPASENIRSLFK